MASSSQDTEITLGTTKLLVLFFGLVAICALFFALGYSLGRKTDPGITTASAAAAPQITAGRSKPGGAAPPMTFYKAVEQKDANPELTPAVSNSGSDAKAEAPANPSDASGTGQSASAAANAPDPATTLPTAGYTVQVAAVSKQEDAESLVDALKKKQYPAAASTSSSDKFFHIQVGPFSDIKEAEAMRARLINDGYNPILKK
ncbi:MAG TPA: SPOR domain-containing protein [Candidatus Angelobacter sp.]